MISVDCLHISLNRTLLLSVGLWPYQQSKLVQFQIILFSSILITCIIFQVKYLMERLLNIYNGLTDKNEIRIMEEYGSYARRYTVGLIMIVIIFVPVLILYPFCSHVFDILLTTNKSPSRLSLRGMYVSEYFIDQKKYFYLILLHGNAALFLGVATLLATGTLLIAYMQYSCGMFRIASYRLEQALAVDPLRKNNSRNQNLIYKELIHAVDMHREAMRFSDTSISKFKVMFAFMIVAGVISASLNFFRALLFGFDAEEHLLPLISITIYLSYVFVGNYVAQEVMDHNNDVFAIAYNIQWYTASLNVQKIILFLLQRSTKVFNLNIAGLIVGSLEGAVSLLSTTLSYFTVLYSIRT